MPFVFLSGGACAASINTHGVVVDAGMSDFAPKGCAFQAQPDGFLCGYGYLMSEKLLHRWSTLSASLGVERRLARVFRPAWVASTSERQSGSFGRVQRNE